MKFLTKYFSKDKKKKKEKVFKPGLLSSKLDEAQAKYNPDQHRRYLNATTALSTALGATPGFILGSKYGTKGKILGGLTTAGVTYLANRKLNGYYE